MVVEVPTLGQAPMQIQERTTEKIKKNNPVEQVIDYSNTFSMGLL